MITLVWLEETVQPRTPSPPSLDFLLSYLGEGGVHWHQIMNYFELNCQIPRILYS